VRPDQVTVVVPTYNERENIPHLAAAVLLHGYRLLVVDDGSPDGTGRLADEISSTVPGMEVMHRTAKAGLGRAYGAGFSRAMDDGAGIVAQMDADFSHNPGDLPRLVAAVEGGADMAIGSRYVPGGATPDWPRRRRWLSRGANRYARAMLGLEVADATAGFRAYRRSALARLPYASAQASGYGFQVEMTWQATRLGLVIAEVPIVFRDRELGQSKMGPGVVAEAMALVTWWGVSRLLPWRN
jgi:dolichol-phosphate mannosyltransferase